MLPILVFAVAVSCNVVSAAARQASPALATVTITGTASGTTLPGNPVSDTATISNGNNPTGTVSFSLYGPNSLSCSTALFTTSDAVEGNGSYPSASYVPTTAGSYEWIASYSGDTSNSAANEGAGACTNASQQVAVIRVTVHALTEPLSVGAGTAQQQPVSCQSGASVIGGGLEVYWGGAPNVPPFWSNNQGVLEPINGAELRGTFPSDSSGNPAPNGATNPAYWNGSPGFGGVNEVGDDATSYAMCLSGDPANVQVVSSSVDAPNAAGSDAEATAVCPTGTVVVGGGALTNIPNASVKPIGSFPSDAAGDPSASGTQNPAGWSAVGQSGGELNGGTGQIVTTAYAICLNDPSLQTEVIRAADVDHPAGPGDTNPGSDPVANVTASCGSSSMLLQGGAVPNGDTSGQDAFSFGNYEDPQQGIHLRGTFPVDSSGDPAVDGATGISSWTAIVQSGGQATPGTDSYAWVLCALPATGGASADVSVTNSGSPNPATAGSSVTFTLGVANAGPDAATAVTVSDPVPAGATFDSATPTSGSCSLSSGTVSCGLGTIANRGSASVSLVVTPASTGSLQDTATVVANESDPKPSNNSASATVAVNPAPPGILASGGELSGGQSLFSTGNGYRLTMQTDGNLVEYTPTGSVAWASNTSGHPGAYLSMQGDGNLVLYTSTGTALWSTATSGHAGAYLQLAANGELAVDSSSGDPLWGVPGVLATGTRLSGGQSLLSPGSGYRLAMQTDGNLVEYTSGNSAVWVSNTSGNAGAYLSMQTDGNLVLYTSSGTALWSTSTTGNAGAYLQLTPNGALTLLSVAGAPLWSPSLLLSGKQLAGGQSLVSPGGGYRLAMQTDGNLVEYTAANSVIWASNTGGHAGAYLSMQGDGNLVLYSSTGAALWASGTSGAGADAQLEANGELTVESSGGALLWGQPSILVGGQQLPSGQSLVAPGGEYRLAMQGDGNLVEYTAANTVVWAPNTSGHAGAYLAMQSDGNLVLYTSSGTALWSTGTSSTGAYLMLGDDGQVVVQSATGRPLWALPGLLAGGRQLAAGQTLTSPNGNYRLQMQTDGNLVEYTSGSTVVWASGTSGNPGGYAAMQGDGNLVIYDAGGHAVWATGTSGSSGAYLVLPSSGALSVVSTAGDLLWS